MKATIEYVERKFNEFNTMMFNGELPMLPIKLSNARTFLGKVNFRKRQTEEGKTENYDFTLFINTKYDLPEQEIEDTLIHEMIHYYIEWHQFKDTSAHGEMFQMMMKAINKKFNRHVSVRHWSTKEQLEQDDEKRQHFICVSRFKTNLRGITIATRTRLFDLWEQMKLFPDVVEQHWYASTDPFWNRYPRAVTPKIYRIPFDELEEHLKDAQELENTGKTIRIKKDSI
jgi:predicted SprT family Zn-dependent metalloprotease